MLLHTLSSFSRRRTPVVSSSGRALLPFELTPFVVALLPLPFAPFPLACAPRQHQKPFHGLLVLQSAPGWLRRACMSVSHA